MKIGILVDELAPGSAPKLIGQAVRGLRALGHDCEALVLVDNGKRNEFPEVYNYHLENIPIRYLFDEAPGWLRKLDFKFPGFSFFSLHHILSFFVAPHAIKRKEYSLIVANCQYSAFAAWGLKIFRNIPYLLLVWDPSTYTLKKIYTKTWLRFFYPVLYMLAFILDKFSTKGARALITSGALHHARFTKISGRPLEDLYPACYPADKFTPYAQREKAILAYDRWDIGNLPDKFLCILENMDEDVKLKIGGFWHPESIKNIFLKAVKEKNLQKRVELLGPLDEKMILGLCSQVILHVHHNEEAFGMQTLEAAGCGCCVIIPYGSGVADLFRHGIHGYFPEKDNLLELVKYARAVFSDLNRAERMGMDAWELAQAHTWSNYARRMEEIIKKYIKL